MHITDLVFHQKKQVLLQNELNMKKQVLIVLFEYIFDKNYLNSLLNIDKYY